MADGRRRFQGATPYNVVGMYPDLEHVREAIGNLEKAGVEAARISMFGPGLEASERETGTRERDRRAVSHVSRRIGLGAVIGAVAGTVLTLITWFAGLVPWTDPLPGEGLVAATIGGVLVGAALGGFLGGITTLRGTESWVTTLTSVTDGNACVVVHADEAPEAQKALEAIRETEPTKAEVLNRNGKRIALEVS